MLSIWTLWHTSPSRTMKITTRVVWDTSSLSGLHLPSDRDILQTASGMSSKSRFGRRDSTTLGPSQKIRNLQGIRTSPSKSFAECSGSATVELLCQSGVRLSMSKQWKWLRRRISRNSKLMKPMWGMWKRLRSSTSIGLHALWKRGISINIGMRGNMWPSGWSTRECRLSSCMKQWVLITLKEASRSGDRGLKLLSRRVEHGKSSTIKTTLRWKELSGFDYWPSTNEKRLWWWSCIQ